MKDQSILDHAKFLWWRCRKIVLVLVLEKHGCGGERRGGHGPASVARDSSAGPGCNREGSAPDRAGARSGAAQRLAIVFIIVPW